MKLPLFVCLILTSRSNCQNVAYPPYYRVSIDKVDDTSLKNEVGLFQKTKLTAEYNGHVKPVYKKEHNQFQRFLLQVETGDWVISTHEDGKSFGLKQQSNYWHYPNHNNLAWTTKNSQIIPIQVKAVWPCEVQYATKYTFDAFKQSNAENISQCLKRCEKSIGCLALTYYENGGECFLFNEITRTLPQDGSKSIKIDCDQEIKQGNPSRVSGQGEIIVVIVSVCCGVLFLTLLLTCAVFLVKRRHSISAARQETVDQNPDYGGYEEDYSVRPTQVVDRNDYYYEE